MIICLKRNNGAIFITFMSVNDLNSYRLWSRFFGHIREVPMFGGKLIFAQVMEYAPWHTFRRIVEKPRGDFNIRSVNCLDHFLCMAFAQLTYREV